jgi:splicing factor 45
MAGPTPPARGGLSLYANLLDSSGDSAATISGAPVVYTQGGERGDGQEEAAAKKPIDPGTGPSAEINEEQLLT